MSSANIESRKIPYGRQSITEQDIAAVVEVLRSDWLTTGPAVNRFEKELCNFTGATHAVAVSNGTAALHAGIAALELPPQSEVLVPAITFAASANAVVYNDCRPVFVDVEPDTLLIDCDKAAQAITERTSAIVAVDYAGQPCDYQALRELCDQHGLRLIADACHSIGGSYKGREVGRLADVTTFSFHPVKHITTGEGGAIMTESAEWHAKARVFRNHGITADSRQRERSNSHRYDMVSLGHNFRLSDINCALGCSQLKRLEQFVARRQEIASLYDSAISEMAAAQPLVTLPDRSNAYHLYPIQLRLEALTGSRDDIFQELRASGLGVNVHYLPVYEHTFYQEFLVKKPVCPVADDCYPRLLSLPMFPTMDQDDIDYVVATVGGALGKYRK